jgi:hypothetical protein
MAKQRRAKEKSLAFRIQLAPKTQRPAATAVPGASVLRPQINAINMAALDGGHERLEKLFNILASMPQAQAICM